MEKTRTYFGEAADFSRRRRARERHEVRQRHQRGPVRARHGRTPASVPGAGTRARLEALFKKH